LFHRRRSKQCSFAPAAPVSAPPRHYQVFHKRIGKPEERVAIHRVLLGQKDADIRKLELTPVDRVEFAAGVAVLSSNAASILSDWASVLPPVGNHLVYGLIASQGAVLEEGSSLAAARLDRIVQTLAPASAPSANLLEEAITGVPASLSVPATDGAIVLLTFQEVAPPVVTICQRVVRAETPDAFKIVAEFAKAGNFNSIFGQGLVKDLGKVNFVNNAADSSLDDVVASWKAAGNVPAAAAVLVFKKDDAEATEHLDRGKAILATLGGGALTIKRVPSSADVPGCPALLVVLPKIDAPPPPPALRTGRLIAARFVEDRHIPIPNIPTVPVQFNAQGELVTNLAQAIPPAFRDPGVYAQLHLGPAGGGDPDALAKTRIKSITKALRDLQLLIPRAPAEPVKLHQGDRALVPELQEEDAIYLRPG